MVYKKEEKRTFHVKGLFRTCFLLLFVCKGSQAMNSGELITTCKVISGLFYDYLGKEMSLLVQEKKSGIIDTKAVINANSTHLVVRKEEEETLENPVFPSTACPGRVLCVDVGGTHLKVVIAKITKNNDIELEGEVTSYKIERDLEKASKITIYEWIKNKLDLFSVGKDIPKIGTLTFSFPIIQHTIKKGSMLEFTKEFAFKRTKYNEDPVEELNAVCEGIVTFSVMVNDTTATLLNAHRKSKNAILGLVLGTGTNCAYFEKESTLKGLPDESGSPGRLCAINTEWGNYNPGPIIEVLRTKEDAELDEKSMEKGKYLVEKMTGGEYFLELVNEKFKRKTGLDLKLSLKQIIDVNSLEIEGIGPEKTESMRKMLRETIETLQERKFLLLGALTAGLIRRIKKERPELQSYFVCLNGSGLKRVEDREILRDRVDFMLKSADPTFDKEIIYDFDDQASLYGSVYALIHCKEEEKQKQ